MTKKTNINITISPATDFALRNYAEANYRGNISMTVDMLLIDALKRKGAFNIEE